MNQSEIITDLLRVNASLEAENARLKSELAASQSTEPVFTLNQMKEALDDAYDAGWNKDWLPPTEEYIKQTFNIIL